jgi:hypothetical protein
MFSGSTIRSMQQEAATKAARERRVPFVYWPGDDLTEGGFPFPSLGDYVPDGWERVESYLVDSSGFGGENEPALTVRGLRAKIEERAAANRVEGRTTGWAIVEIGQFQVVVGEFTKQDIPDTELRALHGDK